jgi:prepilin-type processing-associated H-X9-DG protein
MAAVKEPSNTLLVADLSHLLNHPAVTYLSETDIGYKHSGKLHKATGKANIVFMDGHVESRSLRQTNNIIMDFKK